MITIFNKKRRFEIEIDDTIPQVTFTPRDYEVVPYVKIEIKGFNFHNHSLKCDDCRAFLESFGTNSLDWSIRYSGKTERLDLSSFGSEYTQSHSTFKVSDFEYGSVLKLNLNTLPKDRQEVQKLLEKEMALENYERCCVLRDILMEDTANIA